MDEYTGTFEMVDPFVLVIDHRYQRPEKRELISIIATNPSWEAFGCPICFMRENGVRYVADGQQRIRGLLSSAKPPRQIPVLTFKMNGITHEAEIFVRINEFRKALTPLEKHAGKIVARDPAALAIERAVAGTGFSIGNSGSPRSIRAVASLQYVYNLIGEEGVIQTLTQIRDSWPDDRKALDTFIIRLVGDVIYERQQNGGYTRTKLSQQLRGTSPSALLRKAEEIHFDQGTSKRESLRRALKTLAKV